MQCLVTGGAGFIGSHLVEALLDDNHHVLILDNYSIEDKENLLHARENSKLKIIQGDITRLESIQHYFENIDWVFHLAGLGGIKRSIEKPLEYHHFNVGGTVNILEASQCAKVKRFIYANSASCYGIQESFPTPETSSINPQNPYSLTKHLAEQCVLHWGRIYQLPVISLRLFKVYGPRSPLSGYNKGIFGNFIEQKLTGKPFHIAGDGTQTRDFIYVSDVVTAFLMAAHSEIQNEVFNIGSGETYSINNLAELLGGPITYVPKGTDEMDCTHADIAKAQAMLGWKPEVSLQEGVKKLLMEASKHLSANKT